MGGCTVTINIISTGRKRLGDDFLFLLSQSTPPYLVFRTEAFHLNFSFDILSFLNLYDQNDQSDNLMWGPLSNSHWIIHYPVVRYQIPVKYSGMRNVRMRRDEPPTSQHDSGEVLSPKHRLWVETGEISSSVGLLGYLVIFQLLVWLLSSCSQVRNDTCCRARWIFANEDQLWRGIFSSPLLARLWVDDD